MHCMYIYIYIHIITTIYHQQYMYGMCTVLCQQNDPRKGEYSIDRAHWYISLLMSMVVYLDKMKPPDCKPKCVLAAVNYDPFFM